MPINPNNMSGPLRSNENTTNTQENTSVISSSSVGTNPTTFLYDVGLQNIYQDYQKSIAALNQSEQQSLQDAYYIREMSKKYLGEYASNVGIGDVSGNLLDIYGKYQQTVAGIGADVGAKELTLQQEYDKARRELETGKMVSELEATSKLPGGPIGFADITSQTVIDVNGNVVNNPYYVENFDPKYYNLPEGFDTKFQSIYRDDAGTEYYNVSVDADTESEDQNSRFYNGATSADLFEEFARINGEDARPTQGDIIPLNGVNYVLRDGKFYRLETLGSNQGYQAFIRNAENQEKNWFGSNFITGSKDTTTLGVIKSNSDEDLIYVNVGDGLKYTNAKETGEKGSIAFKFDTNVDSEKEVIAEFIRVHGVKIQKVDAGRSVAIMGGNVPSVVEHKGKLYYMNINGEVWQLRPRNSMTNV